MSRWPAALFVVLAVPASAQSVEVTPFGGYRMGGHLTLAGGEEVEVRDSGAWGMSVGFEVGEDGEVELLFARQPTHLGTSGLFTGQPLFALALETYELGGNLMFGEEKAPLRPYLGVGIGLTRLVPGLAGLESETRFSGSMAGGLKIWLGRHIGLRVELRGLFTVLSSDTGALCGSLSGCLVRIHGSALYQAEARGGVTFRF
jgi:hypothetical protein